MSLSARIDGGPTWPRGVVFDLDGTLVDSAPDIASALNEVLERRDLAPFPLDGVKRMIGGGVPALIRRALQAHGIEPHDIAPLVEDMIGVYSRRATALTVLYDGAEDELIRLQGAGVKLAICTNKSQALTDIILRDMGLAKYFGSVIGAQEGRPHKPEPGALQAVLDELGLEAGHAVMVGDSGADAGAAKAVGMKLVLVGFGYSTTPVENFEPDAVIAHFGELPDALHRIGGSRV